jgi:nucleoside-diphosphate-sugar epimerase
MQCWYSISKTLAEKAAWKFAEENGLDVVVINPGCVLGYALQPQLNASSGVLLNLIKGIVTCYMPFSTFLF